MGYVAIAAVVVGWITYRRLMRWKDPQWNEAEQNKAASWSKRGGGGGAG
jgi:uncharacterized protein YfaT (DUF1175 family)